MTRSGSELEAARAAAAGNRTAQDAVLVPLYAVVRRHLAMQLGFSAVVDEAVQEAMMTVFQSLRTFRGDSSLKTWALTIASRTGRRYVKVQRKHHAMLTKDGTIELDGFTPQSLPSESRDLMRALTSLAPKKREAFILVDVLGLSANEASQVLRTSPNTVASRCRHARLELRAHLREGDLP